MNKKKANKPIFSNSILKNLLIILISGIILIILTLMFLHVYTKHGQHVVVPRLEGLQIEEANTILNAQGLQVEVIDSIYRRDAVPGAIIDQTPNANNRVKEGRSIYVSIYSKSPQQITVPGLEDYSVRQATALLNSLGFTQLTIEEAPAEFSGLVMSVESRGRRLAPDEQIPADSPLKLIVSNSSLLDSLAVDNEILIAPGQGSNDSDNQSEGGFDDSFF